MTSVSKIFNSHLLEMCEDIISCTNDNWEIKKAYHSISMLQKTKPKLFVSFWHDFTTKNSSDLERMKIQFFIQYNFENYKMIQSNSVLLECLKQFQNVISNMSNENKDMVFKYIDNLTKISKMLVNDIKEQSNNF